jgi:hypothetical protein
LEYVIPAGQFAIALDEMLSRFIPAAAAPLVLSDKSPGRRVQLYAILLGAFDDGPRLLQCDAILPR